MPNSIAKGVAIRVPLKAYLSSDHVTPATGKTIAITISKNGGAYGNPNVGATNATEIASGSYYVDLDTTDVGTAGPLFILGSCTGVDPVESIYNVMVLPVVDSSGGVILDLTQVVPYSNTANTTGDCLNAARVQGFGAWDYTTSTALVKNADDSIARTFSIGYDTNLNPVTRT